MDAMIMDSSWVTLVMGDRYAHSEDISLQFALSVLAL